MALMKSMRNSMKTILLILVVAFILTIIVDWGMGGFKSNQPRGVIAKVDGQPIHYEEFSSRLQNELASYREQSGSDPEGYQLQQLEGRVFDNLVQQRLLNREVKAVKLNASDQEIIEEIFNNPPAELRQNQAFQDSTGKFDMQRYQAALNNPGAGEFWSSVEEYLRTTLPMRKLDNLLRATAVVGDEEIRAEYMKRTLKAQAEYLLVPASDFLASVAAPTDAEIKSYHQKHEEEFKEPEKRVIDYVLFDFAPTKADSEAVRQQAQEILTEARAGSNFAELAKLNSQDPGSAEKGGDLGFFARGAMVKPFEEAAFAARAGEIVGPVTSQFGLHIIKVGERKTEEGQEKVQASHILLKYEISPRTREALQEEANYIAETAKEQDLKSVAAAENKKVERTEPFVAGGFIPGVGMEPRVSGFAFRSKKDAVSDVIYAERGYMVVHVAEVIPEHVKSWIEAKETISAKLKNEKALLLAKEKCQSLYSQAQSANSLEGAAAQIGGKVQQTGEFTFSGYISGLGRESRFVGTAFSLQPGTISQPVEGSRGYFLIKLLSKTSLAEADFNAQKETLRNQLLQRKQQAIFGQWYTGLKDKSKIDDFRKDYL
ncbi:MAG TPA: peptidylprolyl isomerase [bacterium]|nr:peptidylprolyl isomerase [bacterium]HPR86693.1 peptidylprolyl isomerase [bacterium]